MDIYEFIRLCANRLNDEADELARKNGERISSDVAVYRENAGKVKGMRLSATMIQEFLAEESHKSAGRAPRGPKKKANPHSIGTTDI